MKVLTAAEMREVDRRTIEMGIPGIVLMENAGLRVVEFLAERFAPLDAQRVLVLCGKGNNGGDGLVIARQIHTRFPRCGSPWCCSPILRICAATRAELRDAAHLRSLFTEISGRALRRDACCGRSARHRDQRSSHRNHAREAIR